MSSSNYYFILYKQDASKTNKKLSRLFSSQQASQSLKRIIYYLQHIHGLHLMFILHYHRMLSMLVVIRMVAKYSSEDHFSKVINFLARLYPTRMLLTSAMTVASISWKHMKYKFRLKMVRLYQKQ